MKKLRLAALLPCSVHRASVLLSALLAVPAAWAGNCVPAPAGLVSWWRGEGDAHDSAGTNHGILVGNTTFVPGMVGSGFRCDGQGSYVRIPNSPTLCITGELTIELWFKNMRVEPYNYGFVAKRNNEEGPVNYGVNAVAAGLGPYLNDPLVGFGFEESRYLPLPAPEAFHHLAVTYRQATADEIELKTFLNGELVQDVIAPGNLANALSDAPLTIGTSTEYPGYEFFDGILDEVSIYNRALTPNEIAAIYAAGSAGKCAPDTQSPGLININFHAHLTPGLSAEKAGLAAVGQSTNDFWNHYSRDGSPGGWITNGALPALKRADGTDTGAGLLVQNAPGCWATESADAMYCSYIYPLDRGSAVLTLTNLPPGNYDVLAYAPNGNFELQVGGVPHGATTCYDPGPAGQPVWAEGRQFVRFCNVDVRAGETVVLTVRPNTAGYAIISGLQILPAVGTPPTIMEHPASCEAQAGETATFTVVATGTPPLAYQWYFNGAELPGATSSVLTLSNVQPAQAGEYMARVTNAFGMASSSNAVLTVLVPPRCVEALPGLVAWWPGEGTGEDIVQRLDGALINGARCATGLIGQAFDFREGLNPVLMISNQPAINLTAAFSVEAWINPTRYPSVDSVAILGKDDGLSARQFMLGMGLNGGRWVCRAHVGTSAGLAYFNGQVGIGTDVWTHVAMTYDGAVLRLFINGAPDGQIAAAGPATSTSAPFVVGGFGHGPWGFPGLVDEVSLYNRALTTNEIAAIYAAGSAGKCLLPPRVLSQPADVMVMAGSNVTFSVLAAGAGPLGYQWTFEGTPLPGATNTTLNLPGVTGAQAGLYAVIVTNAVGAVTSAPARLDVRYLLVRADARILTGNSFVCTGSVTLAFETAFPNGSVFYTRDGSAPNYFSAHYGGPFALRRSATIRAVTYSADFLQSWEAPAIEFTVVPLYPVLATTRGGGAVALDPAPGPYVSNTVVTATATAAEGWTFLGWLGDTEGTNRSVQLTVTRPLRLEAVFGTPLATTVTGAGVVQVRPPVPLIPYGTVAQVVALPEAGHRFAVWGNAASGSANPLLFTVTNPAPTISALFVPLDAGQCALTVIPTGRGSVTVQPRANAYTAGTGVLLSAVPEPGQEFLGWGGDASGVENPLSLVMNGSKSITAQFSRHPTLVVDSPADSVASDGCRLALQGDFGVVYELEVSTNLTDWLPLATATNTLGQIQFNDKTAAEAAHRFYRAREQ